MLSLTTVYFAGLTAGTWLLSGWVRESRRPWVWAAAFQLLCGGWGWASVSVLGWLGGMLPAWTGAQPGGLEYAAVALKAGFYGVFPGAFFFGATFAALERSWKVLGAGAEEAAVGHAGSVYGWNALGSMCGVVLALAWLQPTHGLAGTTRWAAVGSMVAGVAAWAAGMGRAALAGGLEGVEQGGDSEERGGGQLRWVTWLFLGGLMGMGLQVVTIRSLASVLGGTVYSLAWVLMAWLAGTALGATPRVQSWLGARRGVALAVEPKDAGEKGGRRGRGRGRRGRGWQQLRQQLGEGLKHGFAITWVLGMAMGGAAFEFGGRQMTELTGDAGFWRTSLFEGLLVAWGVMPMAMASSAWTVRGMERAMDEGMTSGGALGWNLLGATLAPVLIGVVAIPVLGERGTWQMLLAMGLAWALYLVLKGKRRRRAGIGWAAVAVAIGGIALVARFDPTVMPSGVLRTRRIVGVADTVEVWRWPDRSRTLTVNSRMMMGGTGTAAAAARQAHLPLVLHKNPGKALFLGVGTGITLASARVYPNLRAVGVELVPEVVQVLNEFAPENEPGPATQVVTADARRYLRAPGSNFDVIVGDLFHPDRDGAAWLYTEEHFRAMRDRLEPGGVACQWLPWFQLDERSRASVVSAWLKVFPDSDAWLLRWTTLDTPVIGLVHGGARPSPMDWTRRVGRRGVLQDALRRAGFPDPWQFWGCWIGPLATFAGTGPGTASNTDDRPAILWSAAQGAAEARKDARRSLLKWLGVASAEMPSWSAQSRTESERWDKMRKARDLYLKGLDALIDGRVEAAQQSMWLSVGQSADFPSSYSYLVERALSYEKRMPELGRAMLERLGRERPEVPVGRELLERLEQKQKAKPEDGEADDEKPVEPERKPPSPAP